MKKANSHIKKECLETKPGGGRNKAVAVSIYAIILILIAVISAWTIHRYQIRVEMESRFANVVHSIERGRYGTALSDATEALDLAKRLRDHDAISEIADCIRLIETVMRGSELFGAGRYNAARDEFQTALDYVSDMQGILPDRINDMLETTEGYIAFYALIESAESFAKADRYEAAIAEYEEAKQAASVLGFTDGIEMAEAGIMYVQECIVYAILAEATGLLAQGDMSVLSGNYAESIEIYRRALELFQSLPDQQGIDSAIARIEFAELTLEEIERLDAEGGGEGDQSTEDDTRDDQQTDPSPDPGETGNEPMSNYDYNRGISFDMSILIDYQNREPATLIKMGSSDGRNEGWYNGCGWVATYNALILLGSPHHPAEIVNSFETGGGTVLGGVFGTYPVAIEEYLSEAGYNVSHTLFPQTSMNLDEAIKAARVAILAYAHTRAAHYVTIEYREEDDRFIVYNDSYARTRSASLGFENTASAGAAIDSVTALIRNTPGILFSFSLITVD